MSAPTVKASAKKVGAKTPRYQSGLTLLEVMVALLIFALTGTAVLKAAGEHLS
ncbi:MAG: prepilin-type N-terminal cleavage/methylation domain-containing protein, partial [Pseudomonadota bacterium]|nr:prepilin-type N-terminal cleavage/methylation domain-containing protein [Pseudomonadota bacterium]